jgi:hypothetical protein
MIARGAGRAPCSVTRAVHASLSICVRTSMTVMRCHCSAEARKSDRETALSVILTAAVVFAAEFTTKTPRHQDTKTPRHQDTKTPGSLGEKRRDSPAARRKFDERGSNCAARAQEELGVFVSWW